MTLQPRCPYCLDLLLPDEERVRCARCRTPHHAECFQLNEGCVAFGCEGSDEVASGMSVFQRQELRIGTPPSSRAQLGPFTLYYRRAAAPAERPQSDAPSARLLLETREVREGGRLGGRAVLGSSKPLDFRRLDLVLYQGIGAPRRVARVSLIPSPRGLLATQTLSPGTHPFELELVAPDRTPPVDPFQLELRLVQGVFADLRSVPTPLYLLPALPGAPPAAAPPEPAPAIVVREIEPAQELDPLAWVELPVHRAGSLYDSGELTNRKLQVRFNPSPAAGEALQIEAPEAPPEGPFTIRVEGGGALSMLNLAVHYELAGPDGQELVTPDFPAIEELFILGHGCLDPLRYDRFTGVEIAFELPEERLARLQEVRATGRDAALRLRLALDAIDVSGRVVPTRTRTVTLTPNGDESP